MGKFLIKVECNLARRCYLRKNDQGKFCDENVYENLIQIPQYIHFFSGESGAVCGESAGSSGQAGQLQLDEPLQRLPRPLHHLHRIEIGKAAVQGKSWRHDVQLNGT